MMYLSSVFPTALKRPIPPTPCFGSWCGTPRATSYLAADDVILQCPELNCVDKMQLQALLTRRKGRRLEHRILSEVPNGTEVPLGTKIKGETMHGVALVVQEGETYNEIYYTGYCHSGYVPGFGASLQEAVLNFLTRLRDGQYKIGVL